MKGDNTMKKWLKVFFPIAALLIMAINVQGAEHPRVIRFAYPAATNPGYAGSPLVNVINDQNLFEKEFGKDGIKIEQSYIKTAGPGTNEGFAAGLFDFADYGDFAIVLGKAGGLKNKLILSPSKGGNVYILARAALHINSVKDLRGKKVSYWKGTVLQTQALRVLEANGLTEKDIKQINLSNADALAALAAGTIDALVGSYDRPLIDQGLATLVYDTRNFPVSKRYREGLVVSEDFARKYPDITKRVAKVFIQAAHWASQEKNKEQLAQLLVKTGAKYKYVKGEFGVGNLSLKDQFDPRPDHENTNDYKALIDFSLKNKLIRTNIDVDKWVDKSYADAALKELGLQNYWAK
jgi:sulfonate transport system substrate-binding protein